MAKRPVAYWPRGPRYDAKLVAVTRALHNLTRKGGALVSGSFDEFPVPALRLEREPADLPLSPVALTRQALESHGKTLHKSDGLSYEVDCQHVEQRNPQWQAFVEKIVTSVREPLDISGAARVNTTLRRLVVLTTGGRFDPASKGEEEEARRQRGVFGSLVVVLPSEFTGGGITITGATHPSPTWHPSSEKSSGIAYGAFYNGSVDTTKTEPITSGDALWLEYDLVTTNTDAVPRIAGPLELERAFEASLVQFFEVFPANKRLKIGDDAWRTVREFAADRRFVYPVANDVFETLEGEDRRMAERLAAFCEQSGGQYVLYLAGLHCKRETHSRYDSAFTYSVSLCAPWVKHGARGTLPFKSAAVCYLKEVAPTGFVENLEYEFGSGSDEGSYSDHYSEDDPFYDYDCLDEDYHRLDEDFGNALVVQPATFELKLWAKAPIGATIARLRDLQNSDPHEAVRLARCVLRHRPFSTNRHVRFAEFLDIVMTLNDTSLFNATLSSIPRIQFDQDLLPRAVSHFGWVACVETIENIAKARDFSSGVSLVRSVLYDTIDADRIDRLMKVLVPRAPWANRNPDEVVDLVYDTRRANRDPTVEELSLLLALAHRSSVATLLKLLGNLNAGRVTVQLVAPALVRFASELAVTERRDLLPLIRSLRDKIETTLPVVRNALYRRCPVKAHCAKCAEINQFLVSHALQITITVSKKTQLEHIETTVRHQIRPFAPLAVSSPTPTSLVLTKQSTSKDLSLMVEACVASLSALLGGDV